MKEQRRAAGCLPGDPVRACHGQRNITTLSHGNTIRDAANLLLSTSQQDFPVVHGGPGGRVAWPDFTAPRMASEGQDSYVRRIHGSRIFERRRRIAISPKFFLYWQASGVRAGDAGWSSCWDCSRPRISRNSPVASVGLQPVEDDYDATFF